MRLLSWACVCALLLAALGSSVSARASAGPTVRDIVEFTQIVEPRGGDDEAMRRLVSPDGRHAVIVIRRADVASDRNRYAILLMDLAPDKLAAGQPPAPAPVLTLEPGSDPNYQDPAIKDVRWIDGQTMVFLARIDTEFHQAYRLDIGTRQLVQLSRATTPIVSFAVSADARRLVYAAQFPNPPMQDGARSIVYGNQSFWSVKHGQDRLVSQVRKYRFYVADAGDEPARALGEPFLMANLAPPLADISPDGRWALLPRYEPERRLEWSQRYPLVDELAQKFWPALRTDPLRYFSGAMPQSPRRMTAWRLDDGVEQMVVDAPDDALPGWSQFRVDKIWQGNGASVVLAGTHLPIQSGRDVSRASHVIEYWPQENRWTVIAKLDGRLGEAMPRVDGFAVTDNDRVRRFRRVGYSGWEELAGAASVVTPQEAGSGWTVRVDEALNRPQDVVADGPGGKTVRITHLNPQFDPSTWGEVVPFSWRDAKGRPWIGGLIEGEGTRGRRPLPLVIQTYGYSPDHFYLDGPNKLNGGTSAYPGRAFVREGVLVLAMGLRPLPGSAPVTNDYKKLALFNDGVRGAVNALVRGGRVDPKRIGIIGWSTTGERVLNMVTFSDLPVRAATLADGDENTVHSYMFTYGFSESVSAYIERLNHGLPFGRSRSAWLRSDPALNTDCVNTALRIESYGEVLNGNYDIYALLRRQYKPVEMVIIPGGFHSLSTPSERMISLQGNIDWYRFWLKGEARTEPQLAGETAASLRRQYEHWRQMQSMKAANDAKPRCAR